jgi:hypothetical protein
MIPGNSTKNEEGYGKIKSGIYIKITIKDERFARINNTGISSDSSASV